MKKTICWYYHHINVIGGVEIAILNLISKLKEDYNIIVAYSYSGTTPEMLFRMAEHATIVNLNHKSIECDIVVYCSIYCQKNRIKAKREFRWLHGCIDDMGVKLPNEPNVEEYISVGKVCKDQLDKYIKKPSTLIYNELNPDIISLSKEKVKTKKSKINLVTVSRISKEKGFERMLQVHDKIKHLDYNWVIVGCGWDKGYEKLIKSKAPSNWEFVGHKDNPFPYIKQADYLLQLSDYEAFGYVMLEAKVLGTPVITTNYPSSYEMIKHGVNGYIVKKDLTDFNAEWLNSKLLFNFEYQSNIELWKEILN